MFLLLSDICQTVKPKQQKTRAACKGLCLAIQNLYRQSVKKSHFLTLILKKMNCLDFERQDRILPELFYVPRINIAIKNGNKQHEGDREHLLLIKLFT